MDGVFNNFINPTNNWNEKYNNNNNNSSTNNNNQNQNGKATNSKEGATVDQLRALSNTRLFMDAAANVREFQQQINFQFPPTTAADRNMAAATADFRRNSINPTMQSAAAVFKSAQSFAAAVAANKQQTNQQQQQQQAQKPFGGSGGGGAASYMPFTAMCAQMGQSVADSTSPPPASDPTLSPLSILNGNVSGEERRAPNSIRGRTFLLGVIF